MIVVDASVAVKWFLPEAGSDLAAQLLLGDGKLVAPDLLGVEVCTTLVRGANIVKANRSHAEAGLLRFRDMLNGGEVTLFSASAAQLHRAAVLAMNLGHPMKDCVYLVLAMEQACPLVTADARFVARAQSLYPEVKLLQAG